jgi:outer membrane receptor protein involved in Fe transport
MKHNKLALAIGTALASTIAFAQPPQIEEISVIGQFVPDEKRGTDQVSNVVGGEQFERTGDANIAESLKRVSGLSTVGGKFVYIRGLGERYSTTLLNGARLPSPEPINRVVPMDLFPTAVLDSVLVQKTYSAAYPSEFGGGVLQMRTKKSTDEFFWNITSSVGMVQDVNFQNGFRVDGGDNDFLGYDDGWRDKPELLLEATGDGEKLQPFSPFTGVGQSPEELQAIGRSFNNQYSLQSEDLPPNFSLTTSVGNFHDIGSTGAKVNYLAAVNYSNAWDTNVIERNTWIPGEEGLLQDQGLVFTGTENSVDLSSIFTTGLDFTENQNIRLTSVMLRKTDNIASESKGFAQEGADLTFNEIEWVERELFSNQLQGDHYFPEFNEFVFNWRASRIKAERDSPDYRRYRRDAGQLSSRVDGNQRTWSVLDDTAEEIGIDMSMAFYGPLNSVITPQVGLVRSEKERQSEIRRFGFAFVGAGANDPQLLQQPAEQIFAPENITPNAFQMRELTRPTDTYEAANELNAYYGQVEFNFDDRFRFTVGARQEDFTQEVNTFDLFLPDNAAGASQDSSELLPAFNATFIQNDHQFRVAYSETVSRPDFRELSPAAFTNPVTGREVVGNTELEITEITNYDARWEWYFAFSDYMSLGIFYKEFVNPIEAAIVDSITFRSTYINAATAENQGIEYEIYKRLDFLPDSFFNGIGEDFYVQGNVAFIDSEVQIREEDQGVLTNNTRPLQGQSDWLFNFQMGYEPISGTTATLLYHYYGERIAEVGIEGAPDLVEQPFGELNFVFIRDLSDKMSMTFKAKNIMDEYNDTTQGGFVTTGFYRGREVSFQLDYTF